MTRKKKPRPSTVSSYLEAAGYSFGKPPPKPPGKEPQVTNKLCARCGHDKVFHMIGRGHGVSVGQEYCDDRHSNPCNCRGWIEPPQVSAKAGTEVAYGLVVPGLPMATREQVIERLVTEVAALRSYEEEALRLSHAAEDAAQKVSATRGSILGFAQLLAEQRYAKEKV